jgi:hypothetical protein
VIPTASKLGLLEACPAAGALPAVWTEANDAMRAGTARHRFIERAAEIGRDAALDEVPADAPWREQCEALDLDTLPRGEHEVAYAVDVATDTARRLGAWLGRAYDVSASEVSGTADLIAAPSAERPRWLVVDFKGDEEVEPAGVNLQLGFFALCLARLHQVDEVDVAIVYLRHGGGMRWDRATLGPFDLEAVAERLRGIAARIAAASAVLAAGGTPDVSMGLHCRRCPALLACPAQTAAARALLAAPPTNDALAQATHDEAGAAWVQVKVLGELADRLRAVLGARAEVSGLPLPGGERLVPVETNRRALVMEKAEPVLRARFGAQVDSLVERSLRTDAVAKLARQLAPGKGVKKVEEELWGQLAGAGAVRSSRFVQLRVRKGSQSAAAQGDSHE